MATWVKKTLGSSTIDSLTAAKITTGTLAAGTTITVGSTGAAHTEIGQGAIRILRPDSDGDIEPAIQLGGVNRDVIQIVDVDTGATLAGFTSEGGAVAQDVAADSFAVGGQPLGDPYDPDDVMWGFARGSIGYAMPVTSIADSPTAGTNRVGTFEAAMSVQGGRHYKVELIATVHLPDTGGNTSYIYLQNTLNGNPPTVTSSTLTLTSVNWASTSGGQTQQVTVAGFFTPGDDPDVWYTYRVLVAIARKSSGTVKLLSLATGRSFLTITDQGPVGLAFMADGQLSGGGGADPGGGAPGPAPTPTNPKKSTVGTWDATWGRTWRGSGSVRTDVGSSLLQGRPQGSDYNYAQIGFPPWMLDTISGSVVSKVELYLFAFHWWGPSGTALIGVHGNVSLPSSFSYSGQHAVGGWRRGEGKWVTLPSTWYRGFELGTTKGITLGGGAGSSTVYYGKFYSYNHAKNPQLRITYTK